MRVGVLDLLQLPQHSGRSVLRGLTNDARIKYYNVGVFWLIAKVKTETRHARAQPFRVGHIHLTTNCPDVI